jgi:CheY-like chemotaxis protein/two-component sensor histidine kinase
MKYANEQPDKNDVDAIHGAANHLMQIVNEVLDYSRITSGNFTFEEAPFSPRKLVSEVIQNMLPQAAKKSIKLRLNDEITGEYQCIGDAFRLRQILYNLLGNAIKFTDEGEVVLTVTNEIQPENTVITFAVKDTGIGIPQDKLKVIFNQFEQADVEVAKRFGGSGLGLSIVKSLVDQQNGKMEVESEPGKGSCFSVSIPYKTGRIEIAEKNALKTDVEPFNGVVWLVDDDPFIVRLCSRILTKNQIEHRVFHSAEELLAASWDERIEYVLMDIRMRGMNGDQLCRILREEHGNRYRFVAVTAQALPEERERILNCGFDDILPKPFTEEKLLEYFSTGPAVEQAENVRVSYNGNELFQSMFAMTMGDSEMAREIMEAFVSESRKDVALLAVMSDAEKWEEAALIAHRLAGRVGQAGAYTIAHELRELEVALRSRVEFSTLRNRIEEISNAVLELVAEAEGVKIV